MPENAAQDRRASGRGSLPVSAYSLVERQRVEIPVEGKWPKAWRLLFLIASAAALWFVVAATVHWL